MKKQKVPAKKKKIPVRNRKYKKVIILVLKSTTEILKFNGQIQQQNGEDSLINELE